MLPGMPPLWRWPVPEREIAATVTTRTLWRVYKEDLCGDRWIPYSVACDVEDQSRLLLRLWIRHAEMYPEQTRNVRLESRTITETPWGDDQ